MRKLEDFGNGGLATPVVPSPGILNRSEGEPANAAERRIPFRHPSPHFRTCRLSRPSASCA